MNWNDGDFAEELYSVPSEDEGGYYCPWCKKETDIWFDRTITTWKDEKGNLCEEGMKDRCIECGKSTNELPLEDTSSFKDDIGEAENDGG